MSATNYDENRCSILLYYYLYVGGLMSYLCYLRLLRKVLSTTY